MRDEWIAQRQKKTGAFMISTEGSDRVRAEPSGAQSAAAPGEPDLVVLMRQWRKEHGELASPAGDVLAYIDALKARCKELEQQRDESDRGAAEAAAKITFVAGADIPETIERARAVLVLRCERAEQQRDMLVRSLSATTETEQRRRAASAVERAIAAEQSVAALQRELAALRERYEHMQKLATPAEFTVEENQRLRAENERLKTPEGLK